MSGLTDLEICKRIAEIEGVNVYEYDRFLFDENNYCDAVNNSKKSYYSDKAKQCALKNTQYNPLTDDALCFQLVKKHKVTIEYDCAGKDEFPHPVVSIHDGDKSLSWANDGVEANKAICLAIIEANKLTLQKEGKA